MREIVIGRDAATGKLRLTADKQTATFGADGSVSQQHVKLSFADDGMIALTNLNIDNDSYVNHRGVERKQIKKGDRIVLGSDGYQLTWDIIEPFMPKLADISGLKTVWDDYQTARLEMQIKERRFNTLRSATGLITMFAVVLGMVTGHGSTLYMLLYVGAAIVSLAFFFVAYRASSRIPIEQNRLAEEAKERYRCPQCGAKLVLQDFDMLSQQKGCPHCGATWVNLKKQK